MNLSGKVAIFIATGGYIGKIPVAPGTFGSLIGLLLYGAMSHMTLTLALATLAAITAVAVWAAHRAEALMEKKDPGAIVIDEIAGMGVTFVGLPFTLPLAVAGFILFRGIDIIKPFPIHWLESRFPGGLGVVVDDLAAGLICRILLGIAGLILTVSA